MIFLNTKSAEKAAKDTKKRALKREINFLFHFVIQEDYLITR